MPKFRERLRVFRKWKCIGVQQLDEKDKYANDIAKQTSILSDPSSSDDQKIEALKNIGLSSFTAGKHFKSSLKVVLPLIVEMLDNNTDPELLMSALKTLATASLRHREIKLAFTENQNQILKRVLDIISESELLNISRWSCYCLLLACVDDYNLKVELREYPKIEKILKKAADHHLPWIGWGCNAADVLLKILGFRDPDN